MSAPKWKIKKIASRPGSRKPHVWHVQCPDTLPEPDWDNDFGRGMRCRCRFFRTEGKALRYVEQQEPSDG